MIDEKKIEEAAREAADLYEQDLDIETYEGDTENDGQIHFCREHGADLFKDGAHWAIQEFLKELWHDASEEPKAGEYLYIDSYGQIEKLYRTHNDDPWDEEVGLYEIIKWLQIDDLLPKQEGGNEKGK